MLSCGQSISEINFIQRSLRHISDYSNCTAWELTELINFYSP